MMDGITAITGNLDITFEWIVCIVVFLCGLVFYAKDFKLGLVLQFIASALLFMWFYNAGYNFVPPLVIFFMTLVCMAFTLYFVQKSTTDARGFI